MTTSCQRARSLVSVGLDGTLNDLEEHFLGVHLGRCGACRAFQEDAQAFTMLLRDAPLENVPWPATASVRGHRSRVQLRTIAQIASVASVVIAAGTIALASDLPGVTSDSSTLSAGSSASLALGEDSIRSLRREALVEHKLPILPVTSTAAPSGETTAAPSGEATAAPLKPALPVDGG